MNNVCTNKKSERFTGLNPKNLYKCQSRDAINRVSTVDKLLFILLNECLVQDLSIHALIH
jgi:hypothetical protein